LSGNICQIEALLREQPHQSAEEDVATPIAQAHAVLAVQNRRKKHADTKQLDLL